MPMPSRQQWIRWGFLGIGLALIPLGLLPVDEAAAIWDRVWPVLLFLIVIKVVADLFDQAGLFDVAVHVSARWGRGSRLGLFLLFVLLCVVSTNVLSLDTTAVLLTPVALRLADELGITRWPFAMATLWLANTASLLLPVANLTNLIAQDQLQLPTVEFVRALAVPQAGVLVVVVALLLVRHRSALRGRYVVPQVPPTTDRLPLWTAALLTVGLAVAVLAGVPPWLAGGIVLTVLVAAFAVHQPSTIRPARLWSLAPWSMAAFALGLFLVVTAAVERLTPLITTLIGSGDGVASLLRHAGVAAVGANLVNNLPAYLAIEPFAGDQRQLLAVLVGVNVGPLVTVWGSLATLLWLHACHQQGMHVSRRRLALEGLVAAPCAVAVGVLLLAG